MRLGLVMMLVGCKFSASSKVDGTDTSIPSAPTISDDTGVEDTGGGSETDTGEDIDPEDWDNDNDGYTEAEGDCDDDDASIRPGLRDHCDGIDNNCDGAIDEDAEEEDAYEPNDSIPWDLGLVEEGEPTEVEAFLFDEDDVDVFTFYFEDDWSPGDSLTVSLGSLSPDIAYRMRIINLDDDDEEVFNELSTSVDESLIYEHDISLIPGVDDGAELQVTISSEGGAGCTTPYWLTITHDTWF